MGFKTGMAAGVVIVGGAVVAAGVATGEIDGADISDLAVDAGEAIVGATGDVGDAIGAAIDDLADLAVAC